MLISVLTPTTRPEAMWLVAQALGEQEFRDFEWIISSPDKKVNTVPRRWDNSIPIKFLADPPKPEKAFWTLNRAYNKLIKEAKGDLIVSLQDATYVKPDALSKFAYYFKNGYENFLIAGTGHKYEDKTWRKVVWQDPRRRLDQKTFYPCMWMDIEWNFCSAPKKAIYDVGGFDEKLDELGFGMDGYSINERVNDLGGYDFALDQTNESFSVTHGRLEGWDENNLLDGGYNDRRRELKEVGQWPKLPYLI